MRKDELEEKLQALIAEKEAREMEILARNAEKAEEVFREFQKWEFFHEPFLTRFRANEDIPPLQLANKSEATRKLLSEAQLPASL